MAQTQRLSQVIEGVWLQEVFGAFHAPSDAGHLRCCCKRLHGCGRKGGGCANDLAIGPPICPVLSFRSVDALKSAFVERRVCLERIVCLDAANVLDRWQGGLRDGACCAALSATKPQVVVQWRRHVLALEALGDAWQRLAPSLERLSLSVCQSSAFGKAEGTHKTVGPHCLHAVNKLINLRELYIEVDHRCLEVALIMALGTLRKLERLWLCLRSMEYGEAICGALARRLPAKLKHLGLGGTSRQVRAILEHLSPHGVDGNEVTLAELKSLDLSVDPESTGGRVGEPSGASGGEIPANVVWRVLQRGAPNLVSICLWGALAWYPPVGDVWFAKLVDLVELGRATSLRTLDMRRNRIREDVVARLQERLRRQLGDGFEVLWDGQ
mmetsp:Transcript_159209/g.510704  ORF Transcript_159209/g.510704 Transcript_159209/m.510704 type:complete len:383 (-) Transcript_159209:31-1179(-)